MPRLVSEFSNFFDLQLCESVAEIFLTFDCHDFRGVVSEFGVHRFGFPHEQIDLAVFAFNPDRQTISNSVSCALRVLRSTQVIRDVTRHIEHFASYKDFPALRARPVLALQYFQRYSRNARGDNYDGGKLE